MASTSKTLSLGLVNLKGDIFLEVNITKTKNKLYKKDRKIKMENKNNQIKERFIIKEGLNKDMIKLTLPDGKKIDVEEGTPAINIIKEKIGEGLAQASLGIKLNNKVLDVYTPIKESGTFKVLTFKDEEGKNIFRHSSAHLMAQAVLEIFPEAKLTIGPVVEEGFYYDFDHPPFTQEDIAMIEQKMREISERSLEIKRMELRKEEARKIFNNNKYKLELIEEMPKDEIISAYKQGDFIDLCRGPHVPNTKLLKSVKITKLAGAYWRGDAKNKQLQRFYGISFPDKKDMKEYLEMIEEAKKRDHKVIGEKQHLYMISDLVGKGLPMWLPKGEIIKNEIEQFVVQTEKKYGYVRVSTPHLAKEQLYIRSGHLPHYAESMYPKMEMDDGTYYLKSMNCPHHHLIFNHTPRSYKEMPLRIAEYGTVYRNELSGTLSGLLRVRMLSMNDAHIYCTKEQIGGEIEKVIEMVKYYYDVFGFKDYHFRLSLWDSSNTEKYIDEPENWEYSEEQLRKILKKLKVEFVEAKNEAAFYGPKIDVQFKTVTGREETMSTIQLDFAAKKRFDLRYSDNEGNLNNEVFVIHRAPLSTHERFMAYLIEHYAGKFPLWLSPVQVILLPIADRHLSHCEDVAYQMKQKGLRVEIDNHGFTTNKKIRNAQIQQINYILVVGDKEVENQTVNVRTRDGEIQGEKKVEEFTEKLLEEVKEKKR